MPADEVCAGDLAARSSVLRVLAGIAEEVQGIEWLVTARKVDLAAAAPKGRLKTSTFRHR
ncbi:hypothetical protein SBA7_640019 [Candidatus Sulfotelmatobacter sp. SbA7]|nr:hypothetical protein SBA7_640019 [Candidatus Sulfotelmatobacter sp. SbA7]